MRFFFVFLSLLYARTTWSSKGQLSETDWQALRKGEVILKTIPLEDRPWPQIHIYAFVKNVTPLEAVSYYGAYPHQKDYVPNILESRPLKHIAANDVHVQYKQEMPWPFSDITYTTGNKIEKLGEQHYRLSWYQVQSESTEDSHGFVDFSLKEGKTFMYYDSFVYPKGFFAGALRDLAPKRAKQTLSSIVKSIESASQSESTLLKKYIHYAQEQLAGRAVYQQTESKKK